MSEVTRSLSAIEHGEPSAAGQLLPLVYDELRRLAAAKLAQEKPGRRFRRRDSCMRPICGWWRGAAYWKATTLTRPGP
jgi:hypothetical protein